MKLEKLKSEDLKRVCPTPNLSVVGAYDVTGTDSIMLHEYEVDNLNNTELREEERRKVSVKQFISEGILVVDKTVSNAKAESHIVTECKVEKGERLVFYNDEEGFILPDVKFGTFDEVLEEVKEIKNIYEMSDNNEPTNS